MIPITQLKPGEIFVFGSNLAGRHGAGAAKTARELFGAERGIGFGPTGQCYAIPTKDEKLETLSLIRINFYVAMFLEAASQINNLQKKYFVTPIGCGLAGYKPEQIAPMFRYAPDNVILPLEFKVVLLAMAITKWVADQRPPNPKRNDEQIQTHISLETARETGPLPV